MTALSRPRPGSHQTLLEARVVGDRQVRRAQQLAREPTVVAGSVHSRSTMTPAIFSGERALLIAEAAPVSRSR